ncbi:hypothetical protein PAPYR_2361 [Paratrimastix pyriformis]|uniref:Uncharacterized protein n=1 Tax=Paratrimastix pyriformis TaxID=342808 RepID=A0ABQ8UU94_9EUKA|nr:hypothetical protein PAPYR_2361 [Paratrimastix pyriformis]
METSDLFHRLSDDLLGLILFPIACRDPFAFFRLQRVSANWHRCLLATPFFDLSGYELSTTDREFLTHALVNRGLADFLAPLQGLERLKLRGCVYLTTSIDVILAERAPLLTELEVAIISLVFSPPKHSSSLSLFLSADVQDTFLSTVGKGCPHLRRLDLSDCLELTPPALGSLGTTVPHLSRLHIARTLIDDGALLQLTEGASELRHLDISGCFRLTAPGIAAALARATGLQLLDMAELEVPLDGIFVALGEHCPALAGLFASQCATDGAPAPAPTAVEALATHCTQLAHLDLTACALTDAGLIRLGFCSALSVLLVDSSPALTDAGLCALGRTPLAAAIRTLHAHRCGLVTARGLSAFQQAAPRCQIMCDFELPHFVGLPPPPLVLPAHPSASGEEKAAAPVLLPPAHPKGRLPRKGPARPPKATGSVTTRPTIPKGLHPRTTPRPVPTAAKSTVPSAAAPPVSRLGGTRSEADSGRTGRANPVPPGKARQAHPPVVGLPAARLSKRR